MSCEFQKGLTGNHLSNITADISYGSTVSFRHLVTSEYLYSSNTSYPNGHQQVTLVDHHGESGSLFVIERRVKARLNELTKMTKTIESGRTLRIFHNETEKYITIDKEAKPPLSEQEYNKEVTATGNKTWLGDKEINFELRIVSEYSKTEIAKKRVRAIESVFQIYNMRNKCFLLGTSNKLPKDWADNRSEVICIEKPVLEDSLWYIESNEHPLFNSDSETAEFKSLTILDKIVEVHKVMLNYIGTLVDKFDYKSTPTDWVLDGKGIKFSINDGRAVYFLGNFLVYYVVLIFVLVFACFKLFTIVTYNPNQDEYLVPEFVKFDYHTTDYFIGYLIHLIPFYFVQRDLAPTLYLPSLYFGVLLTCQTLEYILVNLNKKQTTILYYMLIFILVLSVSVFRAYSPLIYGLKWSREVCHEKMFGSGWDKFCDIYN
ncbi:unnamed protein product [Ambrosiozyma monospora]|uniref:Unnamed protein product n=1 Tax=Ambrosiozyma monospora TaxID=43982 RepID=A0ACB5SXD7_AMBMO|nr:unnamed protein product [Ambrosiozyma monospora]